MAAPVITATLNKSTPYLPGEAVTVTVSAVDPDNSTEVLVVEGEDSQGNPVTVEVPVPRHDTFTLTRVFWQRTNVNLTVNGLTATGVMPSA